MQTLRDSRQSAVAVKPEVGGERYNRKKSDAE